jgi:O-antigen ligase
VKALALLLSYAILTMWIGERWAWSLFQCGVFALAGLWLIRPAEPVRFSIWLIPLVLAAAWGLLQLALDRTIYRFSTWDAVLNWFTYLVLFFLALQIFQRPEARHWFLRFSLWFGFALSVLSTVQMFTSGGKYFWLFPSGYPDQVLGPFVYRNQYAAFMEMILPIALWRALRGRPRAFASCVMAAAIFASVVAGTSRAGTLLMCLETAAILFLAWSRGMLSAGSVARAFAAFAIVAIVFTVIVGWQTLWTRVWQRDPYAGRREFLESSIAMVRDRPWMGFGLGNWPRAYPRYALFDNGTFINQAHNDWAQWTVEGGLPFCLILLSLSVMAFPAAVRSLWGIGLLSVWAHCLVEYPLQQRPAIGAWFFVFLGVLAAYRATHSSPAPERMRRSATSSSTLAL